MKKAATTLLFVLFLGTGIKQAQAQIEIGPRIGFDLAGDVEEFFIGADARFSVASLPVQLNPALDYYFVDGFTLFQLNLNALYALDLGDTSFSPYAGGGLGISRVSVDDGFTGGFDNSSTDVGLNALGGLTFGLGNLKAFAQAQLTFGDIDYFTIAGGILFSIGGE